MFTLTIKTDNAAFTDSAGYELSRILVRLAAKLDEIAVQPSSGRLYDINGNTVGEWELTK